ncbi:MAG: PLP-dependent transferase [SAR324 cluster bacterium]|nr:PLP-dependent transferase [SAR324 cluster bacterium]
MTSARLPFSHFESLPTSKTLRKAEPVNGPYSVTATLSSLDEILEWQEGRIEFDYGYYRFVDNPLLCRIQDGLKTHYQLRHCWVYASLKTAAMELMDYLLLTKPQMTLKLISDFKAGDPFSLEGSLCGLKTVFAAAGPDDFSALLPFSEAKDELLVINVRHALEFLENEVDFLIKAKSLRIPILVISDRFPEKPWPVGMINYWVLPLNSEQQSIQGGAILSNMDRQMAELKGLRMQRGPVLSSRNAAYFLGEIEAESKAWKDAIIDRLCVLEKARYGFLFPSGMQSITTLLTLVRRPGKAQIIAVGHLYTDTYALLTYAKQRTGDVENIFIGVDEMDQLPAAINEQTAAIITETITNPLNDVPDLEAIVAIAKKHKIPVIVDNTFATPLHCNPLELGVDFVLHSTTKYFSGKNDHAGGAVLLNDSVVAQTIANYQSQWGVELSSLESSILWQRLEDFEVRMERFQNNALQVAEFLQRHPGIEKLYFHNFPSHRSYEVSQRILTGSGSVMSFTLKRPGMEGLRKFYDAPLQHILKAPSLGSNQTIVCPYTLLAHYHEPDEALEELGLPRYLIRLSVGCEMDINPVIESLDQALG